MYAVGQGRQGIGDAGANIRSATTHTDGDTAEQNFWIDVTDIKQLRRTIAKVKRAEGVLDVRRIDEPLSDDPPPVS